MRTTFFQDLDAMPMSELHEFIIELGEQANRIKSRKDIHGYGVVMAAKTSAKYIMHKRSR